MHGRGSPVCCLHMASRAVPPYVLSASSYVLARAAQHPHGAATDRAKRWPFIQEFSGQPDGVALVLRAARAFRMKRLNLYAIEQRGELVFDTSPPALVVAFQRAHPTVAIARALQPQAGAQSPSHVSTQQPVAASSALQPLQDEWDETIYPEGSARYRLHLARERDTQAGRDKKQDVLHRTGALKCEVCRFDFLATYGEHGLGFIEAHHKTPLHTVENSVNTTMADLALVCSNCHRMLHRGPSLLTIEELRNVYQLWLNSPVER